MTFLEIVSNNPIRVALDRPLSLASIEVEGNIVDSIRRPRASVCVFGFDQSRTEVFVICVCAAMIHNNLLQVVADPVDDVLEAIFAQLQLIEGLDTVGMNRKSFTDQYSNRRSQDPLSGSRQRGKLTPLRQAAQWLA